MDDRAGSVPSPPAAVLFDLDGTLVDREPLMLEALRRAAAAAGAPLDLDEAAAYLGRAWTDIYEGLALADRTGEPFEVFLDRVVSWADRLVADGAPVRVLPGVRGLLDGLDQRSVPVGVVTGSLRREAVSALDLVGGVDRFAVLVTAEDYQVGKPSPEGYSLAARRLGVQPGRCAVVEDSTPGIAAGRAAGMWVVASAAANAPADHPSHQDLRGADVVLAGLDDPEVWAAVGLA